MKLSKVAYTNLFQLAAQTLGDACKWNQIADLNELRDPFIVDLTELRIPSLADLQGKQDVVSS